MAQHDSTALALAVTLLAQGRPRATVAAYLTRRFALTAAELASLLDRAERLQAQRAKSQPPGPAWQQLPGVMLK